MGGQRAADAIAARQSDLARSHATHAPDIEALQQAAREQLPPALEAELGEELGEREQAECDGFIDDRATVFRFFRRSRYSESAALKLMTESLLWRLRTDLASLSLSSLHPIYVDPPAARPPLFWAHPRFVDRYGRPCGVISLRSLERANSNSLDECREYIVACMESVRRHLAHVYARESAARDGKEGAEGAPPPFQMVIAISLLSSGMANLEMELLPFLLDLLKNHFPGMVGAVYVLHYGWVHAGMWGLAKRVLPEQALSRIFFPSNKELAEEHFDPSALPAEFGGDWEVELTEGTNEMMRKYAKPARSASGPPGSPPLHATRERPALSRTGSFESALDEYHSVAPSPWASRAVTPRPSGPPTPSSEPIGFSMSPAAGHLQMTPKAARKLQHLHMTQSARDATPTASGSRSRTISESAGVSPSMTPGASAATSPTIRQKRLRSSSGASAPWAPPGAPTQRRRARNVHFGTSPHESPAASRSHSPVRRVGSLRDFRLSLPGSTPGEGVDPLRAESPDSDHSDSKVTETTKPRDTRAKLGFFARWRSGSHGQQAAEEDKARTYREQLRSQQAQQAEGSLGEASVAVIQGTSEASPRSAIDEEIERGPSSPKLQVPFIEEPPLSAGIGAGRFLSRRTRKYERLPGVVSPYNASNPFWGYPAYAMNNSAAAAGPSGRPDVNALGIEVSQGAAGEVPQRFDLTTGHARHLHARRRKRDLMRTLAYLFVLRLLSAHRSVRARFIRLYHAVVGLLALGSRGEAEEGSRRWQEAERRYERLRNAGLRGETETMVRMQQQRALEERKRLQGKPIATLPQKRWLLLVAVLLVVLRRSTRERAWRAAAATTHSAHALLRLSASKTAQLSSSAPLASAQAAIRSPRSVAAAAAAAPTFTGLHLRQRLGLVSSS